jgi:hypothetical protein
MRGALDEYRIEGVRTTIPFHRRVFRHPAFLAADFDTSFVEKHRADVIPQAARPPRTSTGMVEPPDAGRGAAARAREQGEAGGARLSTGTAASTDAAAGTRTGRGAKNEQKARGPEPVKGATDRAAPKGGTGKAALGAGKPIGPYDTLPPGLGAALEAAWEPEDIDDPARSEGYPGPEDARQPRPEPSGSSAKVAGIAKPAGPSAKAPPSGPRGSRPEAEGLPLSSADIAILTIAIAAHEKAQSFAETPIVAASRRGGSVKLPEALAGRQGGSPRRGWRETARLEGLRDGRT